MPKETPNPFNVFQSQYVLGEPAAAIPLKYGSDHAIELRAFGQSLSVFAPKIDFLRADSLWRLRHIYEPALATQTLTTQGVAVDIGAGFGAFALPFAKAYPGWRVFCFEPDPVAFAFLQRNIHDLLLPQITALPFAVGYQEDAPQNPKAVRAALRQVATGQDDGTDALRALLPVASHSKSKINLGYLELGQNMMAEFETVQVPTLAAAMLDVLSPRLLKIVAPKAEAQILCDLSHSRIDHVIGESWGHINSALIHVPSAGKRQTWMPRAGQPKLALRRPFDASGRLSRLDVILALPAAADADYSSVASILSDPSDEISVLAVGDGSFKQEALLRSKSGHDPRLRFCKMPSLGKAAAWNFGRMQSAATHLAFVDCESFPTKGFFSSLLDLARQTGAEVVQGPYHLLDSDPSSQTAIIAKPTSPKGNVAAIERYQFADTTYRRLENFTLMTQAPSIWRRVYRRDFLDNRAIWFPEHLEVNGEFAFQTLTLHHSPDVPELEDIMFGKCVNVLPAQDQARDALESFQFLIKYGAAEGWNDFSPVFRAFASQVNACAASLPPHERREFIGSATVLWVNAQNTFGTADFMQLPLDLFQSSDSTQPN